MSKANHWTAWQIDEQMAKAHIFPRAASFCEDFTSAYLRPAAIAANVPDAERLILWYDPADLVVHPDRSSNAKEVFALGEVSGEYLREATGIPEDAAPSDEERLQILAFLAKDPALLAGEETPVAEQTGADTEPGPPPAAEPPEAPPVAASAFDLRVARILGAADSAVTRARAAAGSKARTRARSCEDCSAAIDGLANHLVFPRLATLGKDAELSLRPADLVKGAASEFAETLRRYGVEDGMVDALARQVESYAATTLGSISPDPLPTGFEDFLRKHRERVGA